MEIEIENIKENEIEESIELIRKIFDEYVGKDYSEEGQKTFYKFIEKDEILKRLRNDFRMICAKYKGKVIGIEAIRDKNHISLFFVDAKYQRMGIGRKLFENTLKKIKKENPEIREITVNSSPYAKEVYERMGFKALSVIEEKDGIKYIPMAYKIDRILSV